MTKCLHQSCTEYSHWKGGEDDGELRPILGTLHLFTTEALSPLPCGCAAVDACTILAKSIAGSSAQQATGSGHPGTNCLT